jgi:hypothetical protein
MASRIFTNSEQVPIIPVVVHLKGMLRRYRDLLDDWLSSESELVCQPLTLADRSRFLPIEFHLKG